MALVALIRPSKVDDPVIKQIFDWVTQMEGKVPNHFYVEMNFPEFFKAKLGATKVRRRTRSGRPSPAGWGRWDDGNQTGAMGFEMDYAQKYQGRSRRLPLADSPVRRSPSRIFVCGRKQIASSRGP